MLIPDILIQQLVLVIQNDSTLFKGVRSILFLLHKNVANLCQYADIILDSLIYAKNRVICNSYNDLHFLSTINMKNLINKSIRYKDVRGNSRDAVYFSILSSLILLSSLPTIFIDNYIAISVSPTGILKIYSLSASVTICSTLIHNSAANKIVVFSANSAPMKTKRLNRDQDYFILSLSRQERMMSFYLFNDRNIPYKSILKQLRNNHYQHVDYSSTSLINLAVLFIPCNSSIQSDVCTLCRKRRCHAHNYSDYFIFSGTQTRGGSLSGGSDGFIKNGETNLLSQSHGYSSYYKDMDEIDYSSLPIGAVLSDSLQKMNEESMKESARLLSGETPLLTEANICYSCHRPITKVLRSSSMFNRRCGCCGSVDHVVINPQSLMPTAFSQDCYRLRHVPPSILNLCSACETAIFCGSQPLSQCELSVLARNENDDGYGRFGAFPTGCRTRTELANYGGVTLSVLLAHVGHNVDDRTMDQDFKITIRPWGEYDSKKPEAFRIYLQLSDLVIIWYDVLVKNIKI